MDTMKNTDRMQTWTHTTDIKEGHEWGAIRTVTTEVLDFDALTVSSHTVGIHEGTRVNEKSTRAIDASATPEKAATYRAKQSGYRRVG